MKPKLSKGARIESIHTAVDMILARRTLWWRHRPMPAGFLQNWSIRTLEVSIRAGYLHFAVLRYRGYTISYDPPPIPVRDFDWRFAHDDYDGAPDSTDQRCGTAGSPEACCREIDAIEDGREEPAA